MLFLFVAGFVAILAGLAFARYLILRARGDRNNDWIAGGIVLSAVAVIVVIIGFAVSGAAWSGQISDFENIKKFQKVEVIYKTKAEALTAEFAKHLADAYPKHEKDIFDKISPDKVSLYLAKYPELKASETLVALVGHINKLQSAVYDQQIKVEQALKDTRFRLRNPWYFGFMIPAS